MGACLVISRRDDAGRGDEAGWDDLAGRRYWAGSRLATTWVIGTSNRSRARLITSSFSHRDGPGGRVDRMISSTSRTRTTAAIAATGFWSPTSPVASAPSSANAASPSSRRLAASASALAFGPGVVARMVDRHDQVEVARSRLEPPGHFIEQRRNPRGSCGRPPGTASSTASSGREPTIGAAHRTPRARRPPGRTALGLGVTSPGRPTPAGGAARCRWWCRRRGPAGRGCPGRASRRVGRRSTR